MFVNPTLFMGNKLIHNENENESINYLVTLRSDLRDLKNCWKFPKFSQDQFENELRQNTDALRILVSNLKKSNTSLTNIVKNLSSPQELWSNRKALDFMETILEAVTEYKLKESNIWSCLLDEQHTCCDGYCLNLLHWNVPDVVPREDLDNLIFRHTVGFDTLDLLYDWLTGFVVDRCGGFRMSIDDHEEGFLNWGDVRKKVFSERVRGKLERHDGRDAIKKKFKSFHY
jgi:hypothetical protein